MPDGSEERHAVPPGRGSASMSQGTTRRATGTSAGRRSQEARGFDEWQENRSWAISPALSVVQSFVKSFEAYPARQASFTPSTAGIVERMMARPSR